MSLSQGRPAGTPDRIEHFRAWLEEYATALEKHDLGALERLFTVEATWRPTPFAPILRGRRRIREYVQALMAERPSLVITVRALGVGSTYAVAHWVSGWTSDAGNAVEDGIMLAAFDQFGRCTSLRTWDVRGDGPVDVATAEA
jgi:SnoaL-like domain